MKQKAKKIFIDYIPALLTAALIITFSIIREQTFLKTLPTIITLVVQILLARANRFGFLLGGINACIYGLSYFDEALYFSCISAVVISAPIQLYSFFNWSKKQLNANHTELKFLGMKAKAATICVVLASWAAIYFGLAPVFATAQLPAFDTFHFAMGIIVSLLAAFRYIDSQYLNIIACTTSIIMWVIICVKNPSNINYLIISFYNLFMVIKAAVNWTKQYIQDKKESENSENERQTASSTSAN